jgi:hypothetical protein
MRQGNAEQMKPIIYLICSTVFMFLFAHGASYALNMLEGKGDKIGLNTEVAFASVSGMDTQQANETLVREIQQWKTEQRITFNFIEGGIPFNSDWVEFNIPETVEVIEEGQSNNLIFNIQKESIKSTLLKEYPVEVEKYIDWDGFFSRLNVYISELEVEGTIDVSSFFKSGGMGVLASGSVKASDAASAEKWADKFSKVTVKPKESFSFIELLGENNEFTAEFTAEVTSAIYKAVLSTSLEVEERHISETVPAGIEAGYEAKVSFPDRDFGFRNHLDSALSLEFDYINGELSVLIKGSESPIKYETFTQNYKEFEPRTIVHYSSLITQSRVIEDGINGAEVEVYKKGYLKGNGKEIGSWKVSTDFYLPKNKVVQEPTTGNVETSDNDTPSVELDVNEKDAEDGDNDAYEGEIQPENKNQESEGFTEETTKKKNNNYK